jgi:hypothetical protein
MTLNINQKIILLFTLSFFMFLTRGSHFLTEFNLPDMSLILFLSLGFFSSSVLLFTLLFALCSFIDFGSASLDITKAFCLTDGYWGLIPTYAILFYTGQFLKGKNLTNNFTLYFSLLVVSITFAFIVSTNTYFLFSGSFENPSLYDSVTHGWNYFPGYLLPNVFYGLIFFAFLKVKTSSQFMNRIKSS